MRIVDPTPTRAFVEGIGQRVERVATIDIKLVGFIEHLQNRAQGRCAPGWYIELAIAAPGNDIDKHELPDAMGGKGSGR